MKSERVRAWVHQVSYGTCSCAVSRAQHTSQGVTINLRFLMCRLDTDSIAINERLVVDDLLIKFKFGSTLPVICNAKCVGRLHVARSQITQSVILSALPFGTRLQVSICAFNMNITASDLCVWLVWINADCHPKIAPAQLSVWSTGTHEQCCLRVQELSS